MLPPPAPSMRRETRPTAPASRTGESDSRGNSWSADENAEGGQKRRRAGPFMVRHGGPLVNFRLVRPTLNAADEHERVDCRVLRARGVPLNWGVIVYGGADARSDHRVGD